jgi:hypothetical protein
VIAWALSASAVIGVLWAVATVVESRAVEQARTAGRFHCGEGMVGAGIVAVALMVFHFAVGAILGVLDKRARPARRGLRG